MQQKETNITSFLQFFSCLKVELFKTFSYASSNNIYLNTLSFFQETSTLFCTKLSTRFANFTLIVTALI